VATALRSSDELLGTLLAGSAVPVLAGVLALWWLRRRRAARGGAGGGRP
jgi:hypothetical protein